MNLSMNKTKSHMPSRRRMNLSKEDGGHVIRQTTLNSGKLSPTTHKQPMSLENTDDTVTEHLHPNSPSVLFQKGADTVFK